jgi:hypothetical protein
MEEGWDIVIDNLTRIRLNGGATAPGPVYATMLAGVDYDGLKTAPDAEYVTDSQNAFAIGEEWYFYNVNDHSVNPLDQVYVIRTSDGAFYKLKITECVATSRTEVELKFRFDPVAAPSGPTFQSSDGLVKYARFTLSGSEMTYFSLKEGREVEISDPATSTAWDLASDFVTIYTNGGTSGPGQGAAVLYETTEFDSVDTAPQGGYVADDSLANPDPRWAVGDSWYTYDSINHKLAVNEGYTYVLRTANGKYAKLEFAQADFAGQSGGTAVLRVEYLENGMDF